MAGTMVLASQLKKGDFFSIQSDDVYQVTRIFDGEVNAVLRCRHTSVAASTICVALTTTVQICSEIDYLAIHSGHKGWVNTIELERKERVENKMVLFIGVPLLMLFFAFFIFFAPAATGLTMAQVLFSSSAIGVGFVFLLCFLPRAKSTMQQMGITWGALAIMGIAAFLARIIMHLW